MKFKECYNDLLAKFGLGPNYIPSKPKKYKCPKCGSINAKYKTYHEDTDIEETVLECPDCGYKGE